MGIEIIRDVLYGRGGNVPLLLDIYRPRPAPRTPMPSLVWLHGGAWRAGDRSGVPELVRTLARHGYFVVSGGYRLSGQASFPAQIHDVKAIPRWLRAHASTYGLEQERIAAAGHSAGAHLAALLGTSAGMPELEGNSGWADYSTAVHAVVALSPPIDALLDPPNVPVGDNAWTQLLGGRVADHPALVRMSNPTTYLTPHSPPFLILHGTNDEIVPIRHPEALARSLREAGAFVTYLPIDGGTHDMDTLLATEHEAAVIDFLTRAM